MQFSYTHHYSLIVPLIHNTTYFSFIISFHPFICNHYCSFFPSLLFSVATVFLICTPFRVSVELASLINLQEEDCPYLLHMLLEVPWSLFNGQVFNQVSLSHQRQMWLPSSIVCFSLGAPFWVSLCLVHNVPFSYTSGIKHHFPPKELLCNTFFSFGLNVLSMSFLHK